MKHSSKFGAAVLVGLLTTVGHSAQAQLQTIYDNTSNFTGSALKNGGTATVSGDRVTKMLADDIEFKPGSEGKVVDAFGFSVANFNATSITVRTKVFFFAADGTGGGPGTLLNAIVFTPFAYSAGSVGTFTTNFTGAFTVPANNKIWAGINFDNNVGGTSATAAQLNNLGVGLFGAPTVGSATDTYFKSTSATPGYSSNPAGSTATTSGSFGWQFQFTAPVPEPAFYQMTTLLLMGGGGALLRRRKR